MRYLCNKGPAGDSHGPPNPSGGRRLLAPPDPDAPCGPAQPTSVLVFWELLTAQAGRCGALGPGEQRHGAGGQVLTDAVQPQPLLGQTQMLLSPAPEGRTRL